MSVIDVLDLDLHDTTQMSAHARQVAQAGGSKAECPVAPSDPMWSVWQLAWSRRRSAMEQASGAMGYRTALMKAEVRRQTEHLPQNRPDPCADVIEDRRRTISVDFQVIVEPFRQAMNDIAAVFTATADAVVELFNTTGTAFADLAALVEQHQPAEVERVQRKRHGFAATCPRHGPTKGGTCMKCARR